MMLTGSGQHLDRLSLSSLSALSFLIMAAPLSGSPPDQRYDRSAPLQCPCLWPRRHAEQSGSHPGTAQVGSGGRGSLQKPAEAAQAAQGVPQTLKVFLNLTSKRAGCLLKHSSVWRMPRAGTSLPTTPSHAP